MVPFCREAMQFNQQILLVMGDIVIYKGSFTQLSSSICFKQNNCILDPYTSRSEDIHQHCIQCFHTYALYSQSETLGSVVFGQRTLTVGLPSHLVLLKIAICYHESFVFWILFHEPSTSPQAMSKFPFQILQTLRNKNQT